MFGKRGYGLRSIVTVVAIVVLMIWSVSLSPGQNPDGVAEFKFQNRETSSGVPAFSKYRGIGIGTTESELLETLGMRPTFESDDDYFYTFPEGESAQFVLDDDRKVKVMSITYSGNDSSAPSHEDVFGKDLAINMTPKGDVYNFVSYEDAGFWISYYRSSSDYPVVTLTVQAL